MMVEDGSIEKLTVCKDKLAQVYKDEVSDDVYDNGLLTLINSAVLSVEQAIKNLNERTE